MGILWISLVQDSPGNDEYVIQPEDILEIKVFEEPDMTTRARVTARGEISFPLLGKIKVSGMPVSRLEEKLTLLLEKDYLVNPHVNVFIERYHTKKVFVMGAVKSPGTYNLSNEKETTVLEAITMAGGFMEKAAPNGTKVIRVKDGQGITIKIKVADITKKGRKDKDIPLKANDIVYVPESFF